MSLLLFGWGEFGRRIVEVVEARSKDEKEGER